MLEKIVYKSLMIKLQLQIVMQSGTVLHLALLKKLSNHYPNGDLSSRFNQFKISSANKCSPRTPNSYHQLSIEKYQHYQPRQTFKNTIKPRTKKVENKWKKSAQNNELNQSLTGWKVDNQYQVNYTEKLKQDKYDFFPKLLDHKRNYSGKLNEKEISSQMLRAKVDYNFIVQDVKTENIIRFKNKQKKTIHHKNKSFLIVDDKQNQNIHPITMCKLNKRNKSNDRSITASPLVKRFNFHFQ